MSPQEVWLTKMLPEIKKKKKRQTDGFLCGAGD
jgi:hypothetical protein